MRIFLTRPAILSRWMEQDNRYSYRDVFLNQKVWREGNQSVIENKQETISIVFNSLNMKTTYREKLTTANELIRLLGNLTYSMPKTMQFSGLLHSFPCLISGAVHLSLSLIQNCNSPECLDVFLSNVKKQTFSAKRAKHFSIHQSYLSVI